MFGGDGGVWMSWGVRLRRFRVLIGDGLGQMFAGMALFIEL